MRHASLWVALVAAVAVMVMLLARSANGDPTTTSTTDTTPTTTDPVTVTAPDPTVPELRRKLRHERVLLLASRHRTRALARTIRHQPTTREAITLACNTYGSCQLLWRRAFCESRLDAHAQNPSGASGLYQFLPSTWRTTPYAQLSIWSPYANAMAAGWMQAHGRGGEWACQ